MIINNDSMIYPCHLKHVVTQFEHLYSFCLLLLFPFTGVAITTSTEATTITSQPTSINMTANATLTTTEETTPSNPPTATTISRHKPQNLCENYATIVDDTRLFSDQSMENKCDFYFKTAVRFISSDGVNLQLKEHCNNEDVNKFRYYCGSAGLTYMEQRHPEISNVPIRASVCMNTFIDSDPPNFLTEYVFPRPDCKCNSWQSILVQNCSGFYVYQLVPISHFRLECPARYCTEKLSKCQFCNQVLII